MILIMASCIPVDENVGSRIGGLIRRYLAKDWNHYASPGTRETLAGSGAKPSSIGPNKMTTGAALRVLEALDWPGSL
jgi:hypothetical protein